MKLVVIESPYAGDVEKNVQYARKAMSHSLAKLEAPIASHLLYTQPGILNDKIPDERKKGIEAGLAWGVFAHVVAVYTDLGITEGMKQGIKRAEANAIPVEYRSILSKV